MNNNDYIDVDSSPVNNNNNDQPVWGNFYEEPKNKGNNKSKGFSKFLGKVAIIVVISLLSGAAGSYGTYYMVKQNKLNLTTNNNLTYVPQSFTESEDNAMSATDAFNKVAPAVVIVSTKSLTDSMFGQQEVEGMGSGFIINQDGYILTNYHVISGAKEVTVTLSDGTEDKATVVNYDSEKDIAMIKLSDSSKVPAVAELGDSDAIYPGAEVIAIGTPLSKNFAQTLTKGVISGNNRTIETENGTSVNLIQTDAAINPGNSGGPLVNTKGQVIGINSMKLGSQTTSSASVEGLGFAIPINEVKEKIDSLSKQMVTLGVSIRDIDSDTAKQYDLPEGVYVLKVNEFSVAEKSGLQVGDVIVECDGKNVTKSTELKEMLNEKTSGESMSLTVVRDGKNIDISVNF
ncbi:trypsin-like peptidase domain-containing protein [Clostridium sp. BJN0001]|uniref:S1C family serine protease n=1 Tax=Clostridium sp. BJN0001 TaxID=2930219 RepID=UPI001FD1D1F7|nr:trypsin-like peptidase domain-containing protein [Clostridium sp. BJN0001]